MSNKNLTEFSERLKFLRETIGLNREEFAKSVNVSGAYIGQLESGKKKNPSKLFLDSVHQKYKINLVWFSSGNGEMYQERAVTSYEDETTYHAPYQEDPQIREMISIMHDLDKSAKADLLRQARKELKLQELKLLKDKDMLAGELIDALEPCISEQQRKLKNMAAPVAEKQNVRNTVAITEPTKELK